MSEKQKLPLGIVELRIKNVLGIEAAIIVPTGEVTLLTGANAQGKSSAINAIFLGLTGQAPGVDEPIRHGTKSAEVVLKLGTTDELKATVTRVIKAGKSPRLTVKLNDGRPGIDSPQKALKTLFDATTLDPSEFKRLSRKDQANRMLKALGVDFSALNEQRQKLFDQRTDQNRELKRLAALSRELPPAPPKDTPDEPVSVKDLVDRQAELRNRRQEYEAFQGRLALLHNDVVDARNDMLEKSREIDELKRQLEVAQDSLKQLTQVHGGLTSDLKAFEAKCPPEPDAVEEERVQGSLASVETVNANVLAKQSRRKVLGDLRKVETKAASLTGAIEQVDADRVGMLQSAMETFPVQGISIDEEGIYVGGVPLDQCSTAEQWETWTRIAMAQNPKLRVILIRDGSDLDRTTMGRLKALAHEEQYWLWIEKVLDTPGAEGIHFEGGAIVAVNGEPTEVEEEAPVAPADPETESTEDPLGEKTLDLDTPAADFNLFNVVPDEEGESNDA